MSRYAIIENNKVINVVIAEEALANDWVEDTDLVANIGDSYVGGKFMPAEVPVEVPGL